MVHFGPSQFEKFEQIWGTVNANDRTLKLKKSIENFKLFVFHLFTCLLFMYSTCKISKKYIPVEAAGGAKLG